MVARRGREFSLAEEELLLAHYERMTIWELVALFRKHGYNRSKKSIARKLEKLREAGEAGYRDEKTVRRAYKTQQGRAKKAILDPTPEEGFGGGSFDDSPGFKDLGGGWGESDWGDSSFDDKKDE